MYGTILPCNTVPIVDKHSINPQMGTLAEALHAGKVHPHPE